MDAQILEQIQKVNESKDFLLNIPPDYFNTLEKSLARYLHNLQEKRIDLLAFIDFQESYLENKKIILNAQRDLRLQYEQLQYAIGTELHPSN